MNIIGNGLFAVQLNACRCHPETCACPNYVVLRPNVKALVRLNDRAAAQEIVDALNFKAQHDRLRNTRIASGD